VKGNSCTWKEPELVSVGVFKRQITERLTGTIEKEESTRTKAIPIGLGATVTKKQSVFTRKKGSPGRG